MNYHTRQERLRSMVSSLQVMDKQERDQLGLIVREYIHSGTMPSLAGQVYTQDEFALYRIFDQTPVLHLSYLGHEQQVRCEEIESRAKDDEPLHLRALVDIEVWLYQNEEAGDEQGRT